ncbi:GNAT family N-acetyltransferase [Nonomuraea jabiensis]|uniref:Putative GNAT superfamily acetyltransferase n=1 Tax=Nonomuraea jabiensis TaxID=882448 RepID=A0A7W9LEK0_9ACTN|nr:GNAT family N-acetyltransferase [Nonomuraea jabiensis]MBB5780778.1 putative GNAT superfamily acetyltransferase [Nonomuraea jabiensis]
MVEVRELHEMAEFEQVDALFDGIWRFGTGAPPITVELMRALAHAGGYVAGAFDGGRLVGGSIGFLASGNALHSHVTGTAAGRGIGFALKLHQRRWALERGLERITWTYDPLMRRNAHFNLAKLGARPREYLPCFYGVMDDAINRGDESDRLLTAWPLSDPRVETLTQPDASAREVALAREEPRGPDGLPPGAVVALADVGGRPVAGPVDAGTVLVAVPADIAGLRGADPGTAKTWRHAVRDVLGGLMAEGRAVTGFSGKSYYVVEKM